MARRQPTVPETRKLAVAFAGPGDSTTENTNDLLNDFFGVIDGEFPEDDVLDLQIVVPVTPETISGKGMGTVLDWLDDNDLAYDAVTDDPAASNDVKSVVHYAENIIKTTDVAKGLTKWLSDLADEGYETKLILLWGENGDGFSELLLDRAESLGVKALDLTAGLDDISFVPEVEATAPVEPEPEPEPVKPARAPRASRRKKVEETAPEPEAETVDFSKVEPTPEGEETLLESVARSIASNKPDEAQELVAQSFLSSANEVFAAGDLPEDLVTRFRYHADEAKRPQHDAVSSLTLVYIAAMKQALAVDNREWSLFLTKVEEALFWAQANVAMHSAAPEAPAAAEEPAETPKRGRGRPRTRTAEERSVLEIWDEEQSLWKRVGKGRVPATARTRRVDPTTGEPIES